MSLDKDALLSPTASTPSHGTLHSALVGASKAVSNMNSTAVDQFHQNMFPVQFHTIRLNTDLNHVPHNWAKTKFQCDGFQSSHQNAFSRFSSINMAHNYKHLVGKVDVISSSKNIKDLLKMPYQKSPHISLMVHRLGKTLLLEEFDVHKNLLRKDAEDWKWLKDFFYRYMNQREDKNSLMAVMNSPKKDPLSDEMYKNLIRHSITASVAGNACITVEPGATETPQSIPHLEEESPDLKGFHHESMWNFQGRSMLVDSDLPIFGTDSKFPCISLRLRDSPPISVLTGLDYWLDNLMSNVPEVAMVYHLNGFVQKYEILRTEDIPDMENSSFEPEEVMDLARNMMAFIKSRAAVEGHTYWLYKNVSDDMVKLYDLTEYCKNELRQDDNPFTVPVGLLCYHVGRNLKISGQRRSADCRAMLENCLRLLNEERHPQICADAHYQLSDMWVPDQSVHDIWQSDGKIADPPDDLYDEDENPVEEQEASGGTETDGASNGVIEEPNLVSLSSTPPVQDMRLSPCKSPRKEDKSNEVALQELVVRGMIKRKAWDVLKVCRIAGETDERCREALSHIRKGLGCIDKDLLRLSRDAGKKNGKKPFTSPSSSHTTPPHPHDVSSTSVDVEMDQIRVAQPFIPIPLHYSPLKSHSSSNSSESSSMSESISPQAEPQKSENESSVNCPWQMELKFQLLRKAAITFYILAYQFHNSMLKRGHTLRYVRYGLHCYECIFKQEPKRDPDALEDEIYFHLIHLAAKARGSLDQTNWESSLRDFEELNEEEAAILHSAQAILPTPREAWIYTWSTSEEVNLKTAKDLFRKLPKLKAYETKPADCRHVIKKQLGVCMMNIGLNFMKQLQVEVARGETFQSIEPQFDKCRKIFDEALSHAVKINERGLVGQVKFLSCGVYECAALAIQNHHHDELNPICKEEDAMNQKIFDLCEKSLAIFEKIERSDDLLKEQVYEKLREKYFKLAIRYFKPAQAGHQQAFKPAKELLHKSLSYCCLDPKSSHVEKSQKLGAVVHFNLAKFYQKELEALPPGSPRQRPLSRKVQDHAQDAYELYTILKWSKSQIMVKWFYVQIDLDEYDRCVVAQESTKLSQLKALGSALTQCCHLQKAIDLIHTDQAQKEDDCIQIPTLLAGVKIVLDLMNKIFMKLLKLEKSGELHDELKKLYLRSLSLTTREEVEFIAFPLSQLMTDVKAFLCSIN